MLKPKSMCKLECMVAHAKKADVIKELQLSGIGQFHLICDERLKSLSVKRDAPLASTGELEEKRKALRSIMERLSPYAPDETGFLDDILSVHPVEPNPADDNGCQELLDRAADFISTVGPTILESDNELRKMGNELERNQVHISAIEPYSNLDWELDWFKKTDQLMTVVGMINLDDIEPLKVELEQALSTRYVLDIVQINDLQSILAIGCEPKMETGIQRALRHSSFEPLGVPDLCGTFKTYYNSLLEKAEELRKSQDKARADIIDHQSKHYRNILELNELLKIEESRTNVFADFATTGSVTIFDLWVPKEDLDQAMGLIEKESGGLCSIKVDDAPEDAPILLDNPKVLQPFELLTNMYSPPKYGRLDPTLVTAPTFVLFFGFMVGDAVYGFLLFLMATLIKRHYPTNKGVSDFMTIIQWLGASTTMFGILTGSFLGNFVSFYLLGYETSQEMARWVLIDPMYGKNAITLIILAALTGAFHTIAGHILGLADYMASGQTGRGIKENGSWLLIIAGVAAGYLSDPFVGGGLFLAGFILLLMDKGLMAAMALPGLLGNVMSYTRLVALNLTTPGMAQAFNLLAALLWPIPFVGPIAAGCVFIVSHIIILLLNSLGSFVHTLRLHYVEYYGTFYEGGGTRFTPFAENRRYTFRR